MRPRIGSLFSGAGGLDLAVAEVLGAETVFVADVCKVDKDGRVGHYGITWNEVLKACGNSVVPQQAMAALRWLLDALERVA